MCCGPFGAQEKRFMYLRTIFCTFQISVDFYYVPVGGRGGGRGGLEKGNTVKNAVELFFAFHPDVEKIQYH